MVPPPFGTLWWAVVFGKQVCVEGPTLAKSKLRRRGRCLMQDIYFAGPHPKFCSCTHPSGPQDLYFIGKEAQRG